MNKNYSLADTGKVFRFTFKQLFKNKSNLISFGIFILAAAVAIPIMSFFIEPPAENGLTFYNEVMTMEDESALRLLNFISAHMTSRLRVGGEGEKPTQTWVYYLNDKEKEALSQTYQLGWLMKDIRRLEQMSNTANAQIARFHRKK